MVCHKDRAQEVKHLLKKLPISIRNLFSLKHSYAELSGVDLHCHWLGLGLMIWVLFSSIGAFPGVDDPSLTWKKLREVVDQKK